MTDRKKTEGKDEPKRVLERETRPLPVDLTEKEIALRGRECGEKMRERAALEATFEVAKKEHKADIEALDETITDLGRALATGQEIRDVECEVVINWDADCVETLRTDTGEVVAQRPIRPEERQRTFQLRTGKKAKEAADASPPAS
jgi:hypothetical protein